MVPTSEEELLKTSFAFMLLNIGAAICVGNADDVDGRKDEARSSKRTLAVDSNGVDENGEARVDDAAVLDVPAGSCPNVCTLVVTGAIVDVGAGIAEVITDDGTGADTDACDIGRGEADVTGCDFNNCPRAVVSKIVEFVSVSWELVVSLVGVVMKFCSCGVA